VASELHGAERGARAEGGFGGAGGFFAGAGSTLVAARCCAGLGDGLAGLDEVEDEKGPCVRRGSKVKTRQDRSSQLHQETHAASPVPPVQHTRTMIAMSKDILGRFRRGIFGIAESEQDFRSSRTRNRVASEKWLVFFRAPKPSSNSGYAMFELFRYIGEDLGPPMSRRRPFRTTLHQHHAILASRCQKLINRYSHFRGNKRSA